MTARGDNASGHQEKLKDGLNEEKMGPRIRQKKRGKKSILLTQFRPLFPIMRSCIIQQFQRDETRNYF